MKVFEIVVMVGIVGAVLGYVSGMAAVIFEAREGLQAEEAEARQEWEEAKAAAEKEDKRFTERPIRADRYGVTWLERWASPILTALICALVAWRWEHHPLVVAIEVVWAVVFVHIALFDIKHGYILNRVSYPALLLALVLSPVTPGLGFVPSLVGGVGVGLFFFLPGLLMGGKLIGGGDAKLGAIVGAVTGLSLAPLNTSALVALFCAVFFGGVVALLLVATRIRGLRDAVAYGPFLCAGAMLILIRGI